MQIWDMRVAKAIVPSLEINDLNVFTAYDLTRYGICGRAPGALLMQPCGTL